MEDSIFTKIIKGEIPCHKIYEDDRTIAFLTIEPSQPGHTLVVPKIQIEQYIDLPDEDYEALWKTVKKVAERLREVMRTERVGVVIKGIDVPHAHVHLIPFNEGQALKADAHAERARDDDLAAIAEKVRF